jgi:hypothetical protein
VSNDSTAQPEEDFEELLAEYMAAKERAKAAAAKAEAMRDRIMSHYDQNTSGEGERMVVGEIEVHVSDRAQTRLMTKKEFTVRYGEEWVSAHSSTSYHRVLSVKEKKE